VNKDGTVVAETDEGIVDVPVEDDLLWMIADKDRGAESTEGLTNEGGATTAVMGSGRFGPGQGS
jgi:hypothetical protein